MDQTLEGVLAQLTALNGVHHASLFSEGQGFFSTLPVERQAAMRNAAAMIGQIFAALRTIDMGHNEVYVEFENHLITAYEIPDAILVLLSTERRINFPMVAMGVKSVTAKIKELLAESAKTADNRATPLRSVSLTAVRRSE